MQEKQISYHIYGRKAYETPLTLLSEVTFRSEKPLEEVVFEKVGTEGWIELVAIPHHAMIYVTREEKS